MSTIQPVFTWVIASLIVRPNTDGLSNVVSTVHWRYHAEYTDSNGTPEPPVYTAEIYGSYNPPLPTSEFIPYEQLTKDIVIQWLEAGLDIQSLQSGLTAMIENKIVPPVVEMALPWTE